MKAMILWEPAIPGDVDSNWWFYNGLLLRRKHCQFPYRFVATDRTYYDVKDIRAVLVNRL